MKPITILASCLCLAMASPAFSQYSKPAGGSTPVRTERQKAVMARGLTPDSAFVIAAAQSAFAGMAFAKIAAEKAASPDVKRFAKRIEGHSGRMTAELRPLLEAQKAPEPTELDPRSQAVLAWLTRLSGTEFDRAYMSNVASMHANEVMVFERAASRAHDEQIKAWASKHLPTVKAQGQSALTMVTKIAG